MERKQTINLLFIIALFLFHLLFWKEKWGLNILLFTFFIGGSLFFTNKENFQEKTVQITGIGTLVLAILVVFVNSALSKVVYSLSLVSFVGFVQQRSLQFIGYSIMSKAAHFLLIPVTLKRQFNGILPQKGQFKNLKYYFKIGILPLLIFSIFLSIYSVANPKLGLLTEHYWNWLDGIFFSGPSTISFTWIGFMLLGAFIVGSLLFDPVRSFFEARQARQNENLQRKPKKASKVGQGRPRFRTSMIALKKEYLAALITFASLNGLLLLVNLLDIRYVWFNFEPLSAYELSQFVHDGTYLLIFSILLAMALLSYFFRGNLNFFEHNKALKIVAYGWIAQNIVLATSVAARNFHYINHYGLAYKRIGVGIFLIIVIACLATWWIKVQERKSSYFIFHRNGWIVYIVLLLTACINWDGIITRHNLAQEALQIDKYFLLHEMPDKNLHLLLDYQAKYKQEIGGDFFKYGIQAKRFAFLNRQQSLTFFSWNYPDFKNAQYLKQKGLNHMNVE